MQSWWGWPRELVFENWTPGADGLHCQCSTPSSAVTTFHLSLLLRHSIIHVFILKFQLRASFGNANLLWKFVILTWERFQLEWSHCRHFCGASVMRLAGCVCAFKWGFMSLVSPDAFLWHVPFTGWKIELLICPVCTYYHISCRIGRADMIYHYHGMVYVAVPCRNRLFRCVFWSHCCIQIALSLNFVMLLHTS